MRCPYSKYTNDEYPVLICNLCNKQCIYTKRCGKEQRYIPIADNIHEECIRYNMQILKENPNRLIIKGERKSKRGGYIYTVQLSNGTLEERYSPVKRNGKFFYEDSEDTGYIWE